MKLLLSGQLRTFVFVTKIEGFVLLGNNKVGSFYVSRYV